jgi:integrase
MASIYRRKKGGCFYITYQARPGERHTVKGCKERAATEALARKLEADAMLRREGVIDTAVEKLSQWEAMPLEDHLKAFEARMRGKGCTEGHVKRTLSFIGDFIEACGFTTPSNLDATKVVDYILDLRRGSEKEKRKPLGARTINARLTALKSLTRWLFREGRMRTDPMMQVGKLNVRTDRRHERRTLDDEELARLIQVAERGPDVLGISGPDRAMLYRLAVETGLRASELASLTPESLDLADLDGASVKVAAAYSKHRRDDIVPVRRDLAEALVVFLKGRPAGARLFGVPEKTAAMMRRDLTAARKAWMKEAPNAKARKEREQSSFLAYRDASNRVADFHALRHTFITRLARSGVAPAVAKSLARHSTIVLTMDHYTHTLIEDERAALDRLPSINAPRANIAALASAGT